jgi:hypothetical protein
LRPTADIADLHIRNTGAALPRRFEIVEERSAASWCRHRGDEPNRRRAEQLLINYVESVVARVAREMVQKAGVDVDKLIDMLVRNASAELTTYYYYTILRVNLMVE